MNQDLSHEDSGDGNSVDRGQILLAVLIGLALIASVIMLLANSDGAMKIALLAALWAAIIGFFLVYRSRKQVEAAAREKETLEYAHQSELNRLEAELVQEKMEISESRRARDQETLEEIKLQLEEMRTQLSELSGREWGYEPTMLRAEARRILELESQQLSQQFQAPQPEVPEPVAVPEPTPEPAPVPEPVPEPEPVEVAVEAEEEPAPGRRRRRHAAPEETGGRRRKDERQGGLSVADLLAAARKKENN
jgi:outer membrane biosynthesis protein TonB